MSLERGKETPKSLGVSHHQIPSSSQSISHIEDTPIGRETHGPGIIEEGEEGLADLMLRLLHGSSILSLSSQLAPHPATSSSTSIQSCSLLFFKCLEYYFFQLETELPITRAALCHLLSSSGTLAVYASMKIDLSSVMVPGFKVGGQ